MNIFCECEPPPTTTAQVSLIMNKHSIPCLLAYCQIIRYCPKNAKPLRRGGLRRYSLCTSNFTSTHILYYSKSSKKCNPFLKRSRISRQVFGSQCPSLNLTNILLCLRSQCRYGVSNLLESFYGFLIFIYI